MANGKIWKLKPRISEKFIKQFLEYSPEILQLLFNRGLKTQRQIDEFFNSDYKQDLHDPFLMSGIREAVKRIQRAIKKQEKIAIFGDFDCDGVCGAVILKTALEKLGADLSGGVQIPDRNLEGYGLNVEAIKKMADQKVDLILTVDCGVSDIKEIELANSLGLDVIVVDHHRLGKKLPPAAVIIDPWQKNDKYPFKDLAGAGVAFKLAQALLRQPACLPCLPAGRPDRQANKNKIASENKISAGWEKWLLDLVALATVADCMPLVGENRTLVKYGLIVLAQTRRIGLQELMKIARLNPVFEAENLKTNLDTYSLGFILAPRLNAAGRMKHASLAFELLMAKERDKAVELAQEINEHNQQRQKLTNEITGQIEEQIKGSLADKNYPVIIAKNKNWPPSVLGLAAGRIADRYHRPTIIFSAQSGEESLIRGSARSIPSFNIIEAISQCSELLEEFGGHPGAAGLSLTDKNFDIFREKINQAAKAKLTEEDLTPVLEIDLELSPEQINWELLDEIVKFEPSGGKQNPYPVFLTKGLEIANLKIVGNGSKHLKLELKSAKIPDKIFHAIGFGLANKNGAGDLKIGDQADIVFELMADEWNGTRNLQLKIIDIKITVC